MILKTNYCENKLFEEQIIGRALQLQKQMPVKANACKSKCL